MSRGLKVLLQRAKQARRGAPVIVVSGLPRSGTSMMMKMLEAGGLEVFVDGIRRADVDNPGGYYELERVKRLPEGDVDWVRHARGKVVKVISELLQWLPSEHVYKVVFMHRDLNEILRSQSKMLTHRSERQALSDAEMTRLFTAHLNQVEGWLARQPHIEVTYVRYSDVLVEPLPSLERVNRLLSHRLDLDGMAAVVDPALYRSGP